MKVKLIIMSLIILLLSGCKAEYQIDIDKNLNIKENIKLISTTEQDQTKFTEFSLFIPINKEIDDYEAFKTKQDNLDYYNQTKSNDLIKINYNFNQETYTESAFVNNAYDFISITKVEDELVLSTSKEFLLFNYYDNLEEVKVTINSKYKLIKSNADEIKKHSYTWIINRANAYGKNIYLKLDSTTEDLTFLEKIQEGEFTNIFTISILLFVVGIIVYIIIKRKGDKRNKI